MIQLNIIASHPSQLDHVWKALTADPTAIDLVDGVMVVEFDLGQAAFDRLTVVEPAPEIIVKETGPELFVPPLADVAEYATVETGTDDLEVIHTPEKPKPVELHLRRHILALLADAKQPAGALADQLDVDVATVKAELAGLREDGLVRLAVVAGWALTDETADPIKRTPVDADAARRRAAEAM